MMNVLRKLRTDELQAIGITKPIELLEACRTAEKRKQLSALTGVSEERIRKWGAKVYPNQKSELVTEVVRLLKSAGAVVVEPPEQTPH